MAVITFELNDGLTISDVTHSEVTMRELSSGDVIDAQLASEKIVIMNDRPVVYTSDVLLGLELLRRQVESVGSYAGPLSIKDLRKLSPPDLTLLQLKADELDMALAEALAARGRTETTG
ncbi:phage tail assembly protein [Moritella viscosa]|uniref:Protein gp41 n=1 Tax=Moritella viscosa TaxID=80854 RepID=A0ABY1H987_9GAMM|nr:phage tail assembly protein [Moritella viscosa]CED61136.1 bacteriophage Mu-like gp41 protein [Moritella viscosa]SGY85063.1 Protein gp41 [Moritella viscosa]SGY87246.1 Protein gp41 [Moritella viscosa]SHN99404.1 Protein gp41 [Moritella viscosa]SHO20102.1 Protein gp41 [Moritella viscosa]